jgi:WD40 repeat protein
MDWIGRIAWSPDGGMLASTSGDKTIRVWNAETGECLRTKGVWDKEMRLDRRCIALHSIRR